MLWFGIQTITNIWKATRHKVEDVINYGYKAYTDLTSRLSQESEKIKQYGYIEKNISSDRSLIKKSDTPHKREKSTSRLLHTTVSEYWKDALYNHWLILIQCLILVTIIILIAPWIGSDCNDDYTFGNSYFDHRPEAHLRQLRKNIDERTNLLIRKPCSYMSFFSSGTESNDRLNKRSGILRRKRAYRRFF